MLLGQYNFFAVVLRQGLTMQSRLHRIELPILLPQPLKCWNYRCVPPLPVHINLKIYTIVCPLMMGMCPDTMSLGNFVTVGTSHLHKLGDLVL
jgi:hypothetical protein